MYRSGKSVLIATVALMLVAAGALYWLTRAAAAPVEQGARGRIHGRRQTETTGRLSEVGLRWHALNVQRGVGWRAP